MILAFLFATETHAGIRNDPVLAEGVQALERNAQTLIRLVGDCLDLARISERPAFKRFNEQADKLMAQMKSNA